MFSAPAGMTGAFVGACAGFTGEIPVVGSVFGDVVREQPAPNKASMVREK